MRKLAREIIDQMCEDRPILGAARRTSMIVGTALAAPARAIARTPAKRQPTLLEYLRGGREPDIVF